MRGIATVTDTIDWKLLRDRAIQAAHGSYGLSLCAECAVVCALRSTGGGRLLALVCVDGGGSLLMPCGRCRQVLLEHGGSGLLIDHPDAPKRLGDLLPDPFGPEDLAAYQRGRA